MFDRRRASDAAIGAEQRHSTYSNGQRVWPARRRFPQALFRRGIVVIVRVVVKVKELLPAIKRVDLLKVLRLGG